MGCPCAKLCRQRNQSANSSFAASREQALSRCNKWTSAPPASAGRSASVSVTSVLAGEGLPGHQGLEQRRALVGWEVGGMQRGDLAHGQIRMFGRRQQGGGDGTQVGIGIRYGERSQAHRECIEQGHHHLLKVLAIAQRQHAAHQHV
jgi:hypothetical protein